MVTKQRAANSGVAVAVASVLAWGLGQAGVVVPAEIVAAASVIIGWGFARFVE